MASVLRVMATLDMMEGIKMMNLMVTGPRNSKLGCAIKAGGRLVYVRGKAPRLGPKVVDMKEDFKMTLSTAMEHFNGRRETDM